MGNLNRILHLINTKCYFFQLYMEQFTETDEVPGQKGSLNKFPKLLSFRPHPLTIKQAVKLENNNRTCS